MPLVQASPYYLRPVIHIWPFAVRALQFCVVRLSFGAGRWERRRLLDAIDDKDIFFKIFYFKDENLLSIIHYLDDDYWLGLGIYVLFSFWLKYMSDNLILCEIMRFWKKKLLSWKFYNILIFYYYYYYYYLFYDIDLLYYFIAFVNICLYCSTGHIK